MDNETHMKPLLATAVTEAVKLAIVDSLPVEWPVNAFVEGTEECLERQEKKRNWLWDPYSIPQEHWNGIDPMALAQNICCRLLGKGGWEVNGVYSGNATPREILDACVERPDQDPLGDIKHALGLKREETDADA